MKIEKIKKTYNDYKLELSWGQVEAIAAALEQNHADPLADELFAEWQWYMERVPGPGEDEDAWEAQQKAADGSAEGAMGGAGGEDDVPIPMPPGSPAGTPQAGSEAEPTFPPEEGEGAPGHDGGPAVGPEGGPEGGAELGLPEPEPEGAMPEEPTAPPPGETDRRLPKPPRE